MKRLPLSQTFQFEGETIAWDVAGAPDAPPLVLVHGWPFSSQVWRRIAPWLARRHRVYWYDMLGYGRSMPAGERDVSLGVQNTVLAAALDHWALTRPHVLAHDFGGATALRTHLLDRRDFETLTLIDPVAMRPWGSPFVAHVRDHEAAFAGLPDYAHEALVGVYLQAAAAHPLAASALDLYAEPWLGEIGKAAFYRQIAQMDQVWTDPVEAALGKVGCPVLLLWGARDELIPLSTGRALAERLPACRLEVIEEAGHLVQEDAPEAILAAMAALSAAA